MSDDHQYIWIFMGRGGELPAGVFSSREKAHKWIKEHQLIGHLAKYPIDVGVYDWAIEMGYFKPSDKLKHLNRENFATGMLEHEHYEQDEG